MLRQSFVFFLVALEVLFGATLHAARDTKILLIRALDQEEPLVVGDHLRVDGVTRRVTEREEVDGIQHIGLADTILTNQTVDLR